jgi:hypothetical protein
MLVPLSKNACLKRNMWLLKQEASCIVAAVEAMITSRIASHVKSQPIESPTCAAGGSCSKVRRAAACCDSAASTAASTPSSCSCLVPSSMATNSAAVGCGLQCTKQPMQQQKMKILARPFLAAFLFTDCSQLLQLEICLRVPHGMAAEGSSVYLGSLPTW